MRNLMFAMLAALAPAVAQAPKEPVAGKSPPKDAGATATAPAAELRPEELVEQIEDLINGESENPEDEKVVAAFWEKELAKVDTLVAEFRARFANHGLRWRVLMLEANAREIRDELKLPIPKGSRAAPEIYAEIVTSPNADPEMKAEASSARLLAMADQVSNKKLPLAAWETQLAAHTKAYPDFADNLVLVEMRLLLVEEHANAKLLPLLEELSKSPSPEIAQLASTRLAAVKTMAELKNKPLDLKFKAFDGSEVDLAKMRGKVVLVDFWATWCGPCMAELPNVIQMHEKYKAKGFEVVGISLDEDQADLTRVLNSRRITWPQYFDGKGWENPYAKKYGIEGIPTKWLVNKSGMVTETNAQEELAEKIEKLLAE